MRERSETWIMTKGVMDKLRKFHHSCVRSMCNIDYWGSWHQHVSSDNLLKRLNIKPIEFYYRRRLLQWAGHVARMPFSRLPRKYLTRWSPHPRNVGGSHTWSEVLISQLKAQGLPTDGVKWVKYITYN
jgi:hypothetical protein